MTPTEILNELSKAITALNTILLGDAKTNVTLGGVMKPSITKHIDDALMKYFGAVGVANSVPYVTKEVMLASSTINGSFGVVYGDTSLNNGFYIKENNSWKKTSWNPLLSDTDSLSINSGKERPLKATVRGGEVSPINQKMADFILDIKVHGARVGKVYKIEQFMNGSNATGSVPTGWRIGEYDESSFPTSTATDRLQVVLVTDVQTEVIRDGIGVLRLVSKVVPDLYFDIVYDGSKLASGTSIRMSLEGDTGYSWIIDPYYYDEYSESNVDTKIQNLIEPLDSMSINAGKMLPFKDDTRRGILSGHNSKFLDFILNIRIKGAKPNKIYKIEQFMNGYITTSGNFTPTGWGISEYDASTFFNSTISERNQIVSPGTVQTEIDRTGVNVLHITPTNNNSMSIEIIYDGTKAGASMIRNSLESDPGFSHYIHPMCYEYGQSSAETTNPVVDMSCWSFHGSSSMRRIQDRALNAIKANFPAVIDGEKLAIGGTYFSYIASTIGSEYSGGKFTFPDGVVGTDSVISPDGYKWGVPSGGSSVLNSYYRVTLSNGIEGNYYFAQNKFSPLNADISVDVDATIGVNVKCKKDRMLKSCALVNLAKNDVTVRSIDELIDMNISAIEFLDKQNNDHTIVMGHFCNRGYTQESKDKIAKLNNVLKTKYYMRYIDIQGYLMSDQVWEDTGLIRTANDYSNISNGVIAESLSYDSGHMSDLVEDNVVALIISKIESLGWYS